MYEGLFAEATRRSIGLDGLEWGSWVPLSNVVQLEMDLATKN